MKGIVALFVAIALAAIPVIVLAGDVPPPGGENFYDLLKNPLGLREFILSPAGLAVVGSLSSLILREIPSFNALESKSKRLIAAGAAIVMALIVYGLSFVPQDVWSDLNFLWYAVLGYGLVYFGQKFTYRVLLEPPMDRFKAQNAATIIFDETGPPEP